MVFISDNYEALTMENYISHSMLVCEQKRINPITPTVLPEGR